jgi:cation/acetate symporter
VRTNLLETVSGKRYEQAPAWMKNWEKASLIKFEDKNGDGLIQYYNDKNPDAAFVAAAAEKGWKGNELTIDQDIMVLANPEIARLPAWVIALVAAGGLAAALSTAAGLLLVISSAVSHDLLKNAIRPNISEKGELRAARIAAAAAVVLAGLIGIYPPDFVAAIVAFAFGLAASSFFPAILLGIFVKRINKEGAVAGMLSGLLFTSSYIIGFKFLGWSPDNYLLGISPEGIGSVGMVINMVVTFLVSGFTPPPPARIQDLIDDIRTPRGAGQARSH